MKKTRKVGQVNVGLDGNMLRLQFPSFVSQRIWGIKQKYKALGLNNTPENMAKAQEIAAIAQMDLLRDEFDTSLEKYNPFLLDKTIEKIEPVFPKLLEICQKHFEQKIKLDLAPGTEKRYRGYFRVIEQLKNADIIKDAVKIKDFINEHRKPLYVKRILRFIHRSVDWAKRNQLIPKEVENPYNDLAMDVPGKTKYKKPNHILDYLEQNDEEIKAYSPQEAHFIIEEFSFWGYPKGAYRNIIEFLFLTGCRTGEAIALQWEDVNEDCSEIVFRHSFCRTSESIRGLKTERFGKTLRKFPCGQKLRQLLLNIRDSQTSPKGFVFTKNGKFIKPSVLRQAWAGSKSRKGVIERLIEQKKVDTYIAILNVMRYSSNSEQTSYEYFLESP